MAAILYVYSWDMIDLRSRENPFTINIEWYLLFSTATIPDIPTASSDRHPIFFEHSVRLNSLPFGLFDSKSSKPVIFQLY